MGENDTPDATAPEVATTRRSLLKKAAAAPLVAGAAWVAPRVEGLSLVPDMAAAQSGAGTVGPFTVPGAAEQHFLSPPPQGVGIAVGTFTSMSDESQPTQIGVYMNEPQPPPQPCVFANFNAVTPVPPIDPNPLSISLVSPASGFNFATVFITSNSTNPINAVTVTFDLLCT